MSEKYGFEPERARLTLLAYRMCGSWADAEDVVQTVAAEYLRAPGIVDAVAWLTTTTVRRSIDALRARQRRPEYVGPWLPEPLVVSDDGPYRQVEEREALSTAFLVLAESLTAPQRAAVVLRALGYSHTEVAEILGLSPAACRQHHSRAMRRLAEVNHRDAADDPELSITTAGSTRGETVLARALLTAFLRAAQHGDVTELTRLLHEQVVAYQDGGGAVQAARRALVGPSNIARFTAGVAGLYRPFRTARLVTVGGSPGAILTLGDTLHVVSVQIRDDRIYRLFDVCNPAKHTTVGRVPVAG